MMRLSLPADLERFVQAQVESGEYLAPGEVLVHALSLLQDHCELRKIRLGRLRREIQRGVDQLDCGEYRALTDEKLKTFVSEIEADGRRQLDIEESGREARPSRQERWALLHGRGPNDVLPG